MPLSSDVVHNTKYTLETFDFGDGDESYLVELPISPFGSAPVAAQDTTDQSKELITDLISKWEELWPEILERLQDGIRDYGAEHHLGSDEFLASVSRMDPEMYMGDKSDTHFRVEFEEPPVFDFYLRGTEIVHWQAVF